MRTVPVTFLISTLCAFAQETKPPAPEAQPEETVVFRSDVALARVDAQVIERGGSRPVTGLTAADFIIKDAGQVREIRNFASEEMPVDIVLLLDVSRSMTPHVTSLARASRQALGSLGDDDRVAIMVFDRSTRVHSKFLRDRGAVADELERVIDHERFDGGTDITRGLVDAAEYMRRNARKDVRRAIVILTDDRTERDRNEKRVLNALYEADSSLSALIAPEQNRRIYSGGGGGGGGWPQQDPWGGVILGRRGGGPWGGYPGGGTGGGGPVYSGGGLQSAGTSEIARESGGDSMSVYDASAFQDTLARIRQKYALYFNAAADGARADDAHAISVELSPAARRRYPDAQVKARRSYAGGGTTAAPVVTTGPSGTVEVSDTGAEPAEEERRPTIRRRPTSQPDDTNSRGPSSLPPPAAGPSDDNLRRQGGWRRVDEPSSKSGPLALPEPNKKPILPPLTSSTERSPAPQEPQQPQPTSQKQGGWRKATPEDLNPPPPQP